MKVIIAVLVNIMIQYDVCHLIFFCSLQHREKWFLYTHTNHALLLQAGPLALLC